jgi:hypothetical protein
MWRDVTHDLEDFFLNIGIGYIPIKCDVTLKSLLHE